MTLELFLTRMNLFLEELISFFILYQSFVFQTKNSTIENMNSITIIGVFYIDTETGEFYLGFLKIKILRRQCKNILSESCTEMVEL